MTSNIKKKIAEQLRLVNKLDHSFAIQNEHPDIFKDGTVRLIHFGNKKTGREETHKAYLLTAKGEKVEISAELYEKLTGKKAAKNFNQ